MVRGFEIRSRRGASVGLRAALIVNAWSLALGLPYGAYAAGLKCECTNCTYKSGRTEVPYVFDPKFNATAGR